MINNTQVPKNHISFRTAFELREFNYSFLQFANVECFYFLKRLGKDKMAVLTMAPDCNKYIVDHGLAASDLEFSEGVHYLPATPASAQRLELSERFNLHHNLEIVKTSKNGPELFGFASSNKNPAIINDYFNKLELFERFIGEFKERANFLIHQSTQDPIYLPTAANTLQKNKITLSHKNQLITLSQRDLQLLQLLCQGYTAKETANFLGLSPRTVESYLERLKYKLNIFKKAELIKFAFNYYIDQLKLK